MIQEQAPPHPQSNYHFIRGQYASVKIKMQPQSLLVDVPLEWQMDKIKCLLIKIMFKLQFDMFCFHHDGQEIPGDWTLRSVIEQDHDFQCIRGDHYVLTFVKHEVKTQRFEKYYLSKMKPLIKSLEASPFEPILHPAYYSMKYLNHINHIPIEGGRELIVNFNQLQQMQNVINEQRRENQVGPNIGMNLAGNLGQNGGNNGGWLGWLGVGVIRFIQIVSLLTIGQFLYNNSSMNVFIVIALLCITYFAIQVFKKQKNRDPNPAQTKQQNNQAQQSGEEVSLISKLFYRCLIFLTERTCQVVECLLAFLLALFPNWTVQAHKEWFKGTHSTIDLKINQWRLKVGHQGSDPYTDTQQQQQTREQHDETDQDIQIKDSEDMHKLHQE